MGLNTMLKPLDVPKAQPYDNVCGNDACMPRPANRGATLHCISLQTESYVIIEINETPATNEGFKIKCLVPRCVSYCPISKG